MRHLFLVIVSIIFYTAPSYCQSSRIICGNSIFEDIIRDHYPELEESIHATFEAAKQHSRRGQDSLTVNVVVHIVWNEEAENLSDEIIYDQIRVLNEDFNKRNPDIIQLRDQFQPVAGSANIHFNLAGIVRVHTDALFEVDLLGGTNIIPEVKHADLGGSDAWDTESYVNIWVCKIQPLVIFGQELGQILGFAFPPNNLPNWPEDSGAPNADEDGVVMDYRVVGSNNPNTIVLPGGSDPLIIKGRSTVHEVGHYFGLRHIWGDGGTFGPNDCDQSDGIEDTPYANAQSSFDCDTTKNTCSHVEPHYGEDVPDLVENYMDYSSETCMTMFTQGQASLMRSILDGPRSGLLNPLASIQSTSLTNGFRIMPNPAHGDFQLEIDAKESHTVDVVISDISGKKLYRHGHFGVVPGLNTRSIQPGSFSSGLYFVTLADAHISITQKLVIQ